MASNIWEEFTLLLRFAVVCVARFLWKLNVETEKVGNLGFRSRSNKILFKTYQLDRCCTIIVEDHLNHKVTNQSYK